MRTIALLFVLGISFGLQAQLKLIGHVADQDGNKVPYANIGIVGMGVGTVTSNDGKFELTVPDSLYNYVLRISSVGFEPIVTTPEKLSLLLKESTQVEMKKAQIQLREVVVSNKKLKKKVIGNKTTTRKISAGFNTNKLGNEVGHIMKIRRQTFIDALNVNIANNGIGKVKFRVNVYDLKDGLPNKKILRENLIVETDKEYGTLHIDLTPYRLVVDENVFVGLEWIEDYPEKSLSFSAGFFKGPIIYRSTSEAFWRKSKGVGMGFNIEVRQ